jgi:polygalacturonase
MPDLKRRMMCHAALVAALAVPTAAALAAPTTRARGTARRDVRRHGAVGDGKHDDTKAFQAAIDDLPDAGGTVNVPPGDYLIDPLVGVQLRSRMHLALAPGARLFAKPNDAERAYVLNARGVEDLEISGGRLIGDRHGHRGTTGEWGHGIALRGTDRVTIRDIHVSSCWGDGISIGSNKVGSRLVPSHDVVIERVECVGNRRQGLTIGRSRRVRVYDSSFIDTGGTLPGAGIDVEPDPGEFARDVVIARCVARGNEGPGIVLYKLVSDATVRDCLIESNRGYGVLTLGATHCVIEDNRIRLNGLSGIGVRPGTRELTIARNEFYDNGRTRRPAGEPPRKGRRHVSIAESTAAIRVNEDNRFLN